MTILIENASYFCPQDHKIKNMNMALEKGVISYFSKETFPPPLRLQASKHIDASGMWLSPSWRDLFVGGKPKLEKLDSYFSHLKTVTQRAGVGHLLLDCDMSDAIDCPERLVHVLEKAKVFFPAGRLQISAALTKNIDEHEIAPLGLLKQAGVKSVTLTDKALCHSLMLYRAMTYAKQYDLVVCLHPLDAKLAQNGVAHESFFSYLQGLPVQPIVAETAGLSLILTLAEQTGCAVHIRNLSCDTSVQMLRRGKQSGLDITASVSIHHLCLNEYDIAAYRTDLKMIPPLRSEQDRESLLEAVSDGTIDMIYSQHRPCSLEDKNMPYGAAKAGGSTLEHFLGLTLELVHNEKISYERLLDAVCYAPAKRFGLGTPDIKIGNPADFILIDPQKPWQIRNNQMDDYAHNTPYEGRLMQGKCFLFDNLCENAMIYR